MSTTDSALNASSMSESRSAIPTSLAGCTIIAKNYLAQARVLAHSFLANEPQGRFYVLVVDGLPEGIDVAPNVRVLGPEDLNIPGFEDMCFRYDVTELCTAVKPTYLTVLFNRFHEQRVAFFDPDILIFRPLTELKALMDSVDIVLIPHLLDPIPLDGKKPSEQDILIAGAYNLGFIALRDSDTVRRLLAWWGERLNEACLVDPSQGLFVDQKWVDLVPSLFASTGILRDPTYDVAYWNLHSRTINREGDGLIIQGKPLAFFHFSGFNPAHPRTLSRHQTRIEVLDGTPVAELLDLYADLLEQRGAKISRGWPYSYNFFDDGSAVPPVLRRLYSDLPESVRRTFGNPFETGGHASFLTWAFQPSKEHANSPFLDALYRARPDVAAVYPDPLGANRDAFGRWAAGEGARQMGYDPRLLERLGVNDESRNGHARVTLSGVNVCGYLRNETGIGAIARGYVAALESAGVPTSLADIAPLSPNRSEDPTLVAFDTFHPYDINLICANADQYFDLVSYMGEQFFQDRYNIGVWFWELPRFPSEWHDRFSRFDEIWAASSFIAGALSPVSPVPVVHMPPVLALSSRGSRRNGRQRLLANPDEFVFLFIFDFRSQFERKNPLDLIEAFRLAFPSADDVRLVIKCVNEDFASDQFQQMQRACSGLPITIQTGYLSVEEMRDLLAACDAYVSLHRSEGLGLTMAEAMALGKPVIATAWSGNMDFMNVSNSFPVAYRLIEIEEDAGPYRAGELWAAPSVPDAVRLMRLVRENREEAFARGNAAKRTIETQFGIASVARKIQERLSVIAQRVARREVPQVSAVSTSSGTNTIGPLKRSIPTPAVPPMDLNSSIYGPLGLVAKRGMNFLLSYHTLYQSQLNTSFANFMREIAAASDQQEASISRLQGEFERLQLETGRALAGASGNLRRVGRLEELARSLDDAQQELGEHVTRLEASVHDLDASHVELRERSTALDDSLKSVGDAHLDLSNRFEIVARQHGIGQTRSEAEAGDSSQFDVDATACHPESPETQVRVGSVEARLAELAARFSARPFMAEDIYGTADLDRPMGYGFAEHLASDAATEAARPFADVFRGSEQFIADRQRSYLPFFEGKGDVVDLGCGRGEFLRLLKESGVAAVGVDSDPVAVARCVADGLAAVVGDAVAYVRDRPAGSLDGIFSAQFIEHISPDDLVDLLALAHDRIRPGGIFIAETVNPESHTALKTFHVDLTHRVPIYPQVLLHLCQVAGFANARIFYPVGGGFTQRQYETAGEYAIVASV